MLDNMSGPPWPQPIFHPRALPAIPPFPPVSPHFAFLATFPSLFLWSKAFLLRIHQAAFSRPWLQGVWQTWTPVSRDQLRFLVGYACHILPTSLLNSSQQVSDNLATSKALHSSILTIPPSLRGSESTLAKPSFASIRGLPPPRKKASAMARVRKRHSAQRRRNKRGASVAQTTGDTSPSHTMTHGDDLRGAGGQPAPCRDHQVCHITLQRSYAQVTDMHRSPRGTAVGDGGVGPSGHPPAHRGCAPGACTTPRSPRMVACGLSPRSLGKAVV